MKIIFTILFSSTTLFTIVFHSALVNTTSIDNISKVKASIKEHIKKQFTGKGNYTECNFGELFTIKPLEIQELDKLLMLKNQLPNMKKNYGSKLDSMISANDSNISRKKSEIRENKIYHYYKINHLFTITFKGKSTLYEFDFMVYPNYKIKDVSLSLKTELTPTERADLMYFINKEPLIKQENKSYENHLNDKMYNQLSNALINSGDKQTMLHQVLKIVRFVRKHNKFDPDVFCASQLKEWVTFNDPYKQNYRAGLFTRLKDVTADSSSNNTIMYHKISYQKEGGERTNTAISFEFDANYIIIEIKEYKKDFDKFF